MSWPGSSVGRALMPSGESWVQIPPRVALLSLKKGFFWGAVELFALLINFCIVMY